MLRLVLLGRLELRQRMRADRWWGAAGRRDV